MALQVETWQVYIGLAIIGIFSGVGSAIGQYLATEHIIKNAKRLFNGGKDGNTGPDNKESRKDGNGRKSKQI